MAFNLAEITAGIRGLASQVRKLRGDIEKARRRHDEIANAPASREDVKAALRTYIEQGADRYTVLAQRALAPLVRKPAMLADNDRVAGAFGLVAATAPQGAPTPRGFDMLFAAVAADLTIAALDRAIDAMTWPPGEGLPLAQRAVELAKLEKSIDDMERQEAALRTEARAAGVILED
jgi:hypothetical protein